MELPTTGWPTAARCTRILMRPPGLKLDLQQRPPASFTQDAKARARLAATTSARDDGHPLALAGIAPDGSLDDPLDGGHASFDQGQIALDELVRLDLGGERRVRGGIFGDDQQTRRVLVEAVHDSGPLRLAAREVRDVREQRIDQRTARVTRRGMHDHAGGLVHDQQELIFKDDRQRDRFGCGRVLSFRHCETGAHGIAQQDALSTLHELAWFRRHSIHCDLARSDGGLDARARESGQQRGQRTVESLSRQLFTGNPLALAHSRAVRRPPPIHVRLWLSLHW